MLDVTLPSSQFSGRDDLYAILRESRGYINMLERRIEQLENLMANTQSNPVMRPNRIRRPKGSKNK
jgi:hypothetical protein